MAKQTAATETAAKDSVDVVQAANPLCADGCGSRVGTPKSTFLQGHDQRLISDLSSRVVEGEMGTFQRALLGLIHRDQTAQQGQYYFEEDDDIMDRINAVSAAVSYQFSEGLSAKFSSAAMRKWEQWSRRETREADRLARAENPKPKRVRKAKAKAAAVEPAPESADDPAESTVGEELVNLRGSLVKVKIGRWTYDATVIGMNQSGKITAVEYTNNKGEDKTTDRFTIVN